MESPTVQSPKIKLLESKKRLQQVAPSTTLKSQFDDLQERIRGYFKLQDTYAGLSSLESEYKDKLHTQCTAKWAEICKFAGTIADSVGGYPNLLGQCLGELDLTILRERDEEKMPLLMPICWNRTKTYMQLVFNFDRSNSSTLTLSLDINLQKVAGFVDAFMEQAKKCWLLALRLDPESPQAKKNLAILETTLLKTKTRK